MIARRRVREIHPIMWLLVPLFMAFFASDWLSANVF
jgi:AGZA family xanthine/uracil permease-like MFS transporter